MIEINSQLEESVEGGRKQFTTQKLETIIVTEEIVPPLFDPASCDKRVNSDILLYYPSIAIYFYCISW